MYNAGRVRTLVVTRPTYQKNVDISEMMPECFLVKLLLATVDRRHIGKSFVRTTCTCTCLLAPFGPQRFRTETSRRGSTPPVHKHLP